MTNLAINREVLIPLLSDKERIDFEVQEEQGFSRNQIIFYNYLIKVRFSEDFKNVQKEEDELTKRYTEFMESMFEKYGFN
ncbi:MAG: hypothetical protein E7G36_00225 [Peptoniphilus rhinitidis]|uniref:hypothetical protein n=1 Tax=Peptoniphilus rhinitidis TaxID=1175452 RepID=UPI00290928E1|nr:hypothetical protein [Peptoniphilus rhinitidis]MDU3750129.1 hypothetical protein [Peptoniphilus rhinitidis]